MQDFDTLKNIWQEPAPVKAQPAPPSTIYQKAATAKMKLQRQQLKGTIMLSLTAIYIAALALFANLNFQHWYTYGAMVLLIVVVLGQAAFMYFNYKKIKQINDAEAPAIHLQQWETYYAFRKKQLRWNMPLYYILLNLAMGIYFIEILSGRPVFNVLILLIVYSAWMLFGWFYLGKKSLKKENVRLQEAINELKSIEAQWNASGPNI